MGHRTIRTGFLTAISTVALVALLFWSSCYYDNEEELYPGTGECDTLNVTYSGSVAPIMALSCNGCHSGSNPPAGVHTDSRQGLMDAVNSARLWGALNHQTGFSPMPKDAPKLSDCDLSKIRIWIDDGTPDN